MGIPLNLIKLIEFRNVKVKVVVRGGRNIQKYPRKLIL